MTNSVVTNLKNSINYSNDFSLYDLYTHRDEIFSDNSVDFLKIFLKASKENTIKAIEIVKLCLDKEADINKWNLNLPQEAISNHYDILLNHPTNPLKIDKFLSELSFTTVTTIDQASQEHLPDSEKIKLQGELITIALDRGTDINNIFFYSEAVLNHNELLLNHPTNPMSKERGLNIIINADITEWDSGIKKNIPSAAKIKQHAEYIKTALDNETDINSFNIKLEAIFHYYDLLLNHPTNSLDINALLNVVTQKNTDIWNSISLDEDQAKLQGKLIQIALDRGANINNANLNIKSEIIFNHYNILLNHPTNPLELNIFLNKVIHIRELKRFPTSLDKNEVKLQGDLIQLALDKGADINDKKLDIDSEIIANHYDILLNHSNSKLDANTLLNKALQISVKEWNSFHSKSINVKNKVELQGKLIKLALDKGAKINDKNIDIDSEIIANHYDILLSHSNSKLDANTLLNKALQILVTEWNSFDSKTTTINERVELQAKLIQIALDKGAQINDKDHDISSEIMINHYNLLLNHQSNPIDPNILLNKVIHGKFSNSYSPDAIKIELEGLSIKLALDKGADISNKNLDIDVESIFNHYDILLNHPNSKLDANILLKKVIYLSYSSSFLSNSTKVERQGELIQIALDRGANITDSSIDSTTTLNHCDIFLNHPTNPMIPDIFLANIIHADTTEYDKFSYAYIPSPKKIKLKEEAIKLALDKRADINISKLTLEQLFTHHGMLLNHPTNAMNINIFINKVILVNINEWNTTLGKNLPNELQLKQQSELITIALNKGTDLNYETINLNAEAVFNHCDILLNHPTNPMNSTIVLKKIINTDVTEYNNNSNKFEPNPLKIKQQGKIIQLALDKGANINEIDIYSENIFHQYAILLNHPTNPLDIDIFLEEILSLSVTEYDSNSKAHNISANKIEQQRKLIELAFDKGANINTVNIYGEVLVNNYNIFLNHPTNPIDIDIFLKKILSLSVTEYDSNSNTHNISASKIKQQGEMIQLALDKGANINAPHIYVDNLVNYYNILLNHPTNPLNIDIFLEHISQSLIQEWDSNLNQYIPSPTKITQQSEFLKISLDKGANLDSTSLYLSHEFILNHYDILLNHPTNSMSYSKLLELSLRTMSYSIKEDGSKTYTELQTKQKTELLEKLYQISQNSLNLEDLKSIETQVIQELLKNNVIDSLTILKFALKANIITYLENAPIYDLEATKIQHNIISDLLSTGIRIDDLSFKELNIDRNHISILKLLLKNGMDPRALLIHDTYMPDFLEVLELAIANKVKFTTLNIIMTLSNSKLSQEALKLVFSNLQVNMSDKFTPEKLIEEYTNQGPKFKERFEETAKNIVIESVIQDMFSKGGSMLHMIIKLNKIETIRFVLENLEYDINITNDKGQTPLFLATSPAVAKLLIKHNADLKILDNTGNIWVNNPSLEIIEYAIENDYLPRNYAEKVALQHFSKGNYEHAAKLYKLGFEITIDPISEMVTSIINGIETSIEINKYQAILNLVQKSGISIPKEFHHLINSYSDEHKPYEFNFLYGLLHKLAKHYINLSKAKLEKILGKSNELDNAYKKLDFEALKAMYPNNLELAQIHNKFDSYYQVLGKALNILDNDFALEALNINGLRPIPLENETTVFRGMKVNLDDGDKDSYFKYGHRGFSAGDFQKTLGFYVDQPWSIVGGKWEYGGTYASVEALWAAKFADGITSFLEADSILMEIRLPKSSPKICGSWKHEYELIPSNIHGENIIAIYSLDINSDSNGKHYNIYNITKNPYIDTNIALKYKEYEEIKSDPESIKLYDSLGCKDLPVLSDLNKSAKYKNYTDFIEHFTEETYASDREQLFQDYFLGREIYVEDFSYKPIGECNLEIECCI